MARLNGKKIIFSPHVTIEGTDTRDATATADDILSGKSAYGAEGTKLNGTIPKKIASEITVSGDTVTVPSGYYASQVTKSVESGSAATPATTITANPTISVSALGVITASVSKSESVTPTVSEGYVTSGTAGTVSVSGSATESLPYVPANIITPTDEMQTAVEAGKFTRGAVEVEGVECRNLTAGNIKAGVTVKVGTSTYSDSVTSVTGEFTSDATATAGDILTGKTAYVNGSKITGTAASENDAYTELLTETWGA